MTPAGEGRNPERRSEDRAVYIISVAAELAGVHPQTLRIYERKGLVTPRRTAGNTRRYSERDIRRLRTIQQLTQGRGVNLAGVRLIIELVTESQRLRARLEHAEAEVARLRRKPTAPDEPSPTAADGPSSAPWQVSPRRMPGAP
ncbi:MAG: helix-turn-helix transcriptional regulator [Actinomycetota bacterium]|nr:helix-turn-helix transcriptional regulator [Actinomycetota bacterium]